LTKTTSEAFVDDGNGNGHTTHGNGDTGSTYSSGSDQTDVRTPWQPSRAPHQRTARRTKSSR
jgi:hypothetical protein